MKSKTFLTLQCITCKKDLIFRYNHKNPKCGECTNQEIKERVKKWRKYNFND